MFEDTIIIFNKKYNSDDRDYNYYRTYLSNVNVDKKKAVNVIKSGLENASSGTIIIPTSYLSSEDKTYISPKKYQQLSEEVEATDDEEGTIKAEIESYFTLQEGDIVVIGEVNYQINEDNTLTSLKTTYDDVYEIVSIDDKLKGGLPHWEVEIK